jgi:glucosamine-6-phosphate deaminase
MGLYRELGRLASSGLDVGAVRLVQLDEYLGIPAEDRRSLYGWTLRGVAGPLGIGPDRIVRLRGDDPDPEAACARYDAAVGRLGGIDLAILGLGPNGHLGFNEPPSPADAPTRVVDLTPESLASNARYWGTEADVPPRALTCGMRLILSARRVLLVAAGAHKREILARALSEAPGPHLPASYLREHPAATILADAAASPGAPAAPVGETP